MGGGGERIVIFLLSWYVAELLSEYHLPLPLPPADVNTIAICFSGIGAARRYDEKRGSLVVVCAATGAC